MRGLPRKSSTLEVLDDADGQAHAARAACAAAVARMTPSERRGRGRRAHLVARRTRDRTALVEAHATSPLRYVTPNFAGTTSATVCLVTFGGGLVDGDRIELDVVVEEGATLVLFTQASTKVFRGSALQHVRARVAGTLVVLFDPVACFAGARFDQRTDVELEGDGACVVLDGFTSGRPAYGERWQMERLAMRTSVRRGADRLLEDAVLLDAGDAPIAPRMAGYDAFLTLSTFGERAASVREAVLEESPVAARSPRTTARAAPLLVAPSRLTPRAPGALVRIAAARPSDAIAEARRRLRNLPAIDAVDTFAARR